MEEKFSLEPHGHVLSSGKAECTKTPALTWLLGALASLKVSHCSDIVTSKLPSTSQQSPMERKGSLALDMLGQVCCEQMICDGATSANPSDLTLVSLGSMADPADA